MALRTLVTALLLLAAAPAFGQGNVQVSILGVPPVLPSPSVGDLVRNYEQGLYPIQVVYTSPSSQPADFRVHVALEHDGAPVAEVTSERVALKPGVYLYNSFRDPPEVLFRRPFDEIIADLGAALRSDIDETGMLPEGAYRLTIEAVPEDPAAMIASLPGSAFFTVRYAEPPVVISPTDLAEVNQTYPVFAWTPVLGAPGAQFEYHFLLVERLAGQTALQAIEANRPYAEAFLTEQTTFVYGPEQLPLDAGQDYVWQITARDLTEQTAISEDGESEIYTFRYLPVGGAGEPLRMLSQIVLEPGFAVLRGLDELDVTEDAFGYTFNGTAALDLAFDTPYSVPVEVTALKIQKTNLASPVLLAGEVEARVRRAPLLGEGSFEPLRLRWVFGEGFEVQGRLSLPTGEVVATDGWLRMSGMGLAGTVTANGRPLASLGDDLVQLDLTSVEATFPGPVFSGTGRVQTPGGACDVGSLHFGEEEIAVPVDCRVATEIAPFSDSQRLLLRLDDLRGTLGITEAALGYDLTLRGDVSLDLHDGSYCGTGVRVRLSDADGMSVRQAASNCPITNPTIDLGVARLTFNDVQLQRLDFDPSSDAWDLALSLDALVAFPALGGLQLPPFNDVSLGAGGFTLPAVSMTRQDLSPYDFLVNGFEVALTSFTKSAGDIGLFDAEQIGPGALDVSFAADVDLPDDPMLPACLRNADVQLSGGHVADVPDQGRVLAGNLGVDGLSGCRWDFGAGYTLVVNDLGGQLATNYTDAEGITGTSEVDLDVDLEMGEPFVCDGPDAVALTELSFGAPLVDGTIQSVLPPCPVEVGPFRAEITDSELRFESSQALGQQASLDAQADLLLPNGRRVSGSFVLDLISGEFTDVQFSLQDPFVWDIPADDPVMSFELDRAEITENGFLVDGRQTLLLQDGTTLGATFDRLLLDLRTKEVTGGSVIFDGAFAFEAGVDAANGTLDYSAVAPGTSLDLSPGLYFELAGSVMIDSLGLHSNGNAAAALSLPDQSFDSNFGATFTQDFVLGLFPFNVRQGRVDFEHGDDRIAYADHAGFHIDPSYLAGYVLPERLPLPTEDIAYLVLKENDQALVDFTHEQGEVLVETRTGQPLELVVPALDPAAPPTVANVTLSNLRISTDPQNPQVVSGSILASVPGGDPAFDLLGRDIPLDLQEIAYGTFPVDGVDTQALFLRGDFVLFEETITDDGSAALYIQNGSRVEGSLDLQNLDAPVQLVSGSDRVLLEPSTLSGMLSVPLDGVGTVNYALTVGGDLTVADVASAAVEIELTPGDVAVTQFQSSITANPPAVPLGSVDLRLNEIAALPVFDYNPQTGFDFAASLDLELEIPLADGETLTFPLNGVEVRDDGLEIPAQDISEASIPGLSLPSINLGGLELTPLAMRTQQALTIDWYTGVSFSFSPSFDFEAHLPDLADLDPPDGLTFTNVTLDDGYLVGSVSPFEPIGGVDIPLGSPQAPTLNITRLSGGLSKISTVDGFRQGVDLSVDGTVADVPLFEAADPSACVAPTSFSLDIVDGTGFEGIVSGFAPCGSMALGPISLEVTSSSLTFAYANDTQEAELSGTGEITLPAPDQGAAPTATGGVTVDLISGELGGSILINEPFELGLPLDDPLLAFTINEAELNQNGFTLRGAGSLDAAGTSVNVQFYDLLLDLPTFAVAGGSASLTADFTAEIGLQPLELSLLSPTTAAPVSNAIRLNFGSDVLLNPTGLVFSGSGSAALAFAGETYPTLRLEYENGFALSLDGQSVTAGRAEFYLDDNGQAIDPLAVLDQSGFDIGGAIASLIPDRIGLPTEDVAYIETRDGNDNLLVNVTEDAQNGGWTVATDGGPLPVVLASLDDGPGGAPTIQTTFSLTTDDAYNITGGSLTLAAQNGVDLEPHLDLPIRLTSFAIGNDGNGVYLEGGLEADLPPALADQPLTADAKFTSSGIEQATVEIGTYTTTYDPTLQPAITPYQLQETLPGANGQDALTVAITGAKLSFGASTGIQLAGTINSSLLKEVDAQDPQPIFYTAGYSNGNWDMSVDPGALGNEIPLGAATFTINLQNGLTATLSANEISLAFNGVLKFDDVLGEPLEVTVNDLTVGATDLQTTPRLLFSASAGTTLPDQQATLFGGALQLLIESPTIALQGRTLAFSSNAGTATFMDEDVDYQNISVDTDGNFAFDEIAAGNINLLGNYVILETLALAQGQEGLELDATLEVDLPDPIDAPTSQATVRVYRDPQQQVQVETTGPSFQLNEQYAVGDVATFELTAVAVDLDVHDPVQSGLFANGRLLIGEENSQNGGEIRFGESGSFPNNAGIGYQFGQLSYNATGNGQFTFEHSFFAITVLANAASSTSHAFQVELGGNATVTIPGVTSSTLQYAGFKVGASGVDNYGNITGGTVGMMDFVSLTLGRFQYQEDENGFQIELTDGTSSGPEGLRGRAGDSAAPTREETVVEYLCFGSCDGSGGSQALQISLGGQNNSDNGAFSGGVGGVQFYQKADGGMFLEVRGANLSLDDMFRMTASMAYATDGNGGMLLRAAAAGTFNVGNQSVGAAVAGKFSNIDNDLSFGLFVAVQSSVGVPIIPGIIDLVGLGGGFFYNPVQADLDVITDPQDGVLTSFGYTPVRDSGPPKSNDIDFALLVYAEVGIGGSSGEYVVEGKTLLQLTSQSVYFDAQGIVMQLDGSGVTSARLEAGMYIAAQRNPFFLDGGVTVNVNVPTAVEGEADIQFFMGDGQNGLIWGIMGNIGTPDKPFKAAYGLLTIDGEFIASGDGFFFDVGTGFEYDPPLISLNAQIGFAIWYMSGPDYALPFGAYTRFRAEACLGICVSARVRAAFATRSAGGFELFAIAQGCIDLWLDEACLKGWVAYDGNFDYGTGSGGKANLISRAQDQRDQFKEKMEELRNQIAAAKDALDAPPPFEGVAFSGADAAVAGYNLYSLGDQERFKWIDDVAVPNELRYGMSSLPSGIVNIRTRVWAFPFSGFENYFVTEPETARQNATQKVQFVGMASEEVLTRLAQAQTRSIRFASDAEQAFDDLMTAMDTSPVRSIDTDVVQNDSYTKSPSFDVDPQQAAQQSGRMSDFSVEIEELDQQYRQAIADIEANVNTLDSLLSSTVTITLEASDQQQQQQQQQPQDVGQQQYDIDWEAQEAAYQYGDFKYTFNPSVNGVAAMYADAIEAIERYYAIKANGLWRYRSIVLNRHSALQSYQSQLQAAVGQMSSNFQQAMGNGTSLNNNWKTAAAMHVERTGILLDLADSLTTSSHKMYTAGSTSGVSSELEDLYDNTITTGRPYDDRQAVINDVETKAMTLWYHIHDRGLSSLGYHTGQRVQDLSDQKSQALQGVRTAYFETSRLIDATYTQKAELMSTLYGVVDSYLAWRQTANQVASDEGQASDSVLVAYQAKLTEIGQALDPPQIAAVQIDPQRNGYYNEVNVSWTATHPLGVREAAYVATRYDESENIAAGMGGYLSVGSRSSATLYPFKVSYDRGGNLANEAYHNTMSYGVGIRVRGPGGNTAIRRANFDVAVGPNGQSTPPASPSDPDGILTEDTSPPRLNLYLSTFYEIATRYERTAVEGGGDSSLLGNSTVLLPKERYWTNDGSTIRLHLVGRDDESDIAEFEYAIGSSAGGTDIVDWTALEGARTRWITQDWDQSEMENVDVAEMVLEAETRYIGMEPGTPYFVSVRATNGQGLSSGVISDQNGLVYDPTPPTAPEPALVYAQMPMFFFGGAPPVEPTVTSPPDLELAPIQAYAQDPETDLTPEISVDWTASSDGESGLQHYEYALSTTPDVPEEAYSDTEATELHLTGGENRYDNMIPNFKDSVYVHVWAVNNAGAKSEPTTFGPMVPRDPTGPSTPKLQVRVAYDKLYLYVPRVSFDKESDLRGFEYSIGTSPGDTDVRAWPSGSDVDYEWSNSNSVGASLAVFFGGDPVPTFEVDRSGLPEGRLYVNFRAVNRQGKASSTVASGPVVLDDTDPLSPNLSVSVTGNGTLKVEADNLHDPESGITKVEYKLRNTTSGMGDYYWSTFMPISGVNMTEQSHDRTFDVSSYGNIYDVRVYVRVTNSAGDQTTSSAKASMMVDPNQYQYPQYTPIIF